MADQDCRWDTFKGGGNAVLGKIKTMIHEGNVRRVIVEYEGQTVAEFPLTAGVVGALLAPALAAIAAVVALYKDCTIHVQRRTSDAPTESAAEQKAS